MIQRLFVLLFLPLFLTACSSSSSDSTASNSGGGIPEIKTKLPDNVKIDTAEHDSFDAASSDGVETTLVLHATSVGEASDFTSTYDTTKMDEYGNFEFIANIAATNFMGIINNPVVSINLDADGNIAGATLYNGTQAHEFSGTNVTKNYFDIRIEEETDGKEGSKSISIDRRFNNDNHSDNNFTAEYMMNIYSHGWANTVLNMENNIQTKQHESHENYMVAGFQTANDDIPASSASVITFTGNGEGEYSTELTPEDGSVEYDTSFQVVANVDFTNRDVKLTASNTMAKNRYVPNSDWIVADQLNFTDALLRYDAGKNNISGNISADGMNGTANARFYGTDDNAANELGGTFLITKKDSDGDDLYHRGFFGATCGTSCATAETMVNGDSLSKASSDANTANEAQSHSFNAIGVQKKSGAPANVAPTFSLTFDADGNMSAASFNLDGNAYVADITTYTDYVETTDMEIDGTLTIGSTHQGETSRLNVTRDLNDSPSEGNANTNFISEYMVFVRWNSNEVSDSGYMISGFETAGDDIPTTGNATFTGNGYGIYKNSTRTIDTAFDVKADVNFANREVTFSTENTEVTYASDGTENLTHPNIENAALSYNATTNAISNASAFDLSVDGTTLRAQAGDIQARFYGTDDNAAKELGGTFNLTNGSNNFYYGWFGAKK
ncbi:MAG: transferrin-binding protein-like solute binding protein [Alphaproteobacteria bacterium]|nr:transferrin-binding protein-like solute binding protein [Alphaproteobacteria bacterium]